MLVIKHVLFLVVAMSDIARAKAKTRQAKRKEKLKKDPEAFQMHLDKDRQRKAKKREAAKNLMSPKEIEEHRLKERMRIRDYRAKKTTSEASASSSSTPYRTTQALGKAVKRAQTSLPASPSKRLCVVKSLAKKVGLSIENSPSTSTVRGLSEETKVLVETFYNSNDISWQAPGRKDRVIIRESDEHGTKVKRTEQVRYLLISLKEAYSKFKESNAEAKIGISKFCELRPQHIKLLISPIRCVFARTMRMCVSF